MKLSLNIIVDSHNTYPKGEVDFWILDEQVVISIDGDREISIKKEDFKKMLHLVQ